MESQEQIAERNANSFDEGLRFHEWPRQSIPRIVNVRATPKGAACPEFVAWLYKRIATPFAPGCPFATDWLTTRFERVT